MAKKNYIIPEGQSKHKRIKPTDSSANRDIWYSIMLTVEEGR